MSVLITRPRHDEANYYLFFWSEEFIDEAKRKNLKYFDLYKDRASKINVESYLKKQSPDIVIFNGHGNDYEMAGHDNAILITKNNAELLKKKNVFMRACNTGNMLGKDIMRLGANGFIGYKRPFMFPMDKDSFSKPLKDKFASPCLECSNQVAVSLIKGHSIQEAQDLSINTYKRKLNEMFNSESSANSITIACLQWNMMNQVCYKN